MDHSVPPPPPLPVFPPFLLAQIHSYSFLFTKRQTSQDYQPNIACQVIAKLGTSPHNKAGGGNPEERKEPKSRQKCPR